MQKGISLLGQQNAKSSLPKGAMPWEGREPLHTVMGFKQAVGLIEVELGYSIYPEAVMLFALIRMPGQPPTIWRRYWTSYVEAMTAAKNLCGDSMEYLEEFKSPMRPVEDLDYEDFLEHLHARLNNEMH